MSVSGRYANADKLGGNMRVNDVVQLVDMRKGISVYVQAKLVVDTLHNYMSSAEELITTKHVPEMRKDKNGDAISLDHADKMVKHYYHLLSCRLHLMFSKHR